MTTEVGGNLQGGWAKHAVGHTWLIHLLQQLVRELEMSTPHMSPPCAVVAMASGTACHCTDLALQVQDHTIWLSVRHCTPFQGHQEHG
jgi:hypothetical protein